MKIGVPKEIKPQENRIGLTPESVKTLVSEGHEVIVENNGGFEAGFENDQYTNAGAKIANTAADIFNDAEIIVKVKEPQKVEVDMIRENQIVYTYLHLAAAKELTEGLVKSKAICIAYETVTDDNGCTASNSVTLTDPTLLTVSITSNDPTCAGLSDGDATALGAGGTAPLSYSWLPTGGSGTTASGLTAGIEYLVTVTDSNIYSQPWTAELSFYATEDQLYEYACHEGNYAMPGILAGARRLEMEEAAINGSN